MKTIGCIVAVTYVLTIWAANWAIATYGFVSVGFGLTAPAGVYFAGVAFTLRDITHDTLGRRWVLAAIVAGAALSYVISPAFAVASAVAFLVSELFDFAVYAPLREQHWLGAVALSNTVGLVVDSMLFLWLAFGSLAFVEGQIVGKLWMTALAVLLLGVGRFMRKDWVESRCPVGGGHQFDEITLGMERCRKCGLEAEYNAYMRYRS